MLQDQATNSAKDVAAKGVLDSSVSFLNFFGKEFKCTGVCAVPLFYWTRPLSDGRPNVSCLKKMKETVKTNLSTLGIVSVVAGLCTFLSFIVQYCLWRKFE